MMKAILKSLVRFTTILVVAAAALAVPLTAQAQAAPGRLRLDSLERLAPKAAEAVNIEIDGFLINFAGSLLSDDDAEERAVKEVVAGLKGVYVKRYEFNAAGQFTDADVAALRDQLRAPGWSRLVGVESRKLDFGNAELYLASAGGRIEGLAMLVVKPKELIVINIVGAVDVDKLKKLGDALKLPRISVKQNKKN